MGGAGREVEETAISLGAGPSARAQQEEGGYRPRTALTRLSPSGRELLPPVPHEPCGSAAAAAGRAAGGRSPAGTRRCARVALLRERVHSTTTRWHVSEGAAAHLCLKLRISDTPVSPPRTSPSYPHSGNAALQQSRAQTTRAR